MVRTVLFILSMSVIGSSLAKVKENLKKKDKHYINLLDKEEFLLSFSLEDYDYKSLHLKSDSVLNVNFFKQPQGNEIEDTVFLNQICDILQVLISPVEDFSKPQKIEAHYMGDAFFKKTIVTKLIFINLNEEEDYRHDVLLGLNICNKKVVSIIKLSEYVDVIGFGDLTYSSFKNGVFIITHALPTDIVVDEYSKSKPKRHKVKIRNNGKLN